MTTIVKRKSEKVCKICEEIRIFRQALDWSQQKMAGQLGISRNWVGMIEAGRVPSANVIKRFKDLTESPILRERFAEGMRNPVRRARIRAGLSIQQVHEQTGYKAGVLQAVEENRAQLSENLLASLKKIFPDFDSGSLLQNDEHTPAGGPLIATVGTKPDILLPEGMTARYIPLISWAQAGELTGVEDQYEFEGHLVINVKDPKAIAVRLRGDSMPPYKDGDVAIAYPSHPPRNGKLVLGKTKDDEAFFKLLTIISPGRYRFTSYNPLYDPFERNADELVWLYPVAKVEVDTL